MRVTGTPSIASRGRPEGSMAPVFEPTHRISSSMTGAPVPGTPSIATSPS